MAKVTLHDFTAHHGQQAIISGSAMRNVACMGRRFGKTHLMTEIIINGKKRGALGAGKPTAWYAPNDSYFANVFKGIAMQDSTDVQFRQTLERALFAADLMGYGQSQKQQA